MLYSVKNYDISDLVLRKINAQDRVEDRKAQLNKRKEQNNKAKEQVKKLKKN